MDILLFQVGQVHAFIVHRTTTAELWSVACGEEGAGPHAVRNVGLEDATLIYFLIISLNKNVLLIPMVTS